MPDPVVQQLDHARETLLDLSLHNRMLNYRPTRRTSIRVVDEQLAQVWRLVVEKESQLEFLAREEHEAYEPARDDEADDDQGESFALPSENGNAPAARHTDRCLQTALKGDALQTSLLRIYQESNSAREELGINVLFLAMGFLHWRPTNRDDTVAAPLFLVPVALERTSAKRRFKLLPTGDAPILNPCIARKLAVDFHIDIPPEPAEWEGFDLPAYQQRLTQAIESQPGWRVADDLFLGLFSFNKYLMYLDLDGETWPADKPLTKHALLRAMCGDRGALPAGAALPSPRDVDRTLDPTSVFQVLDADSSQQAAIAAARAGHSLVIQGPPGTGKSQSIANIISECLAAGKSVLFVSQKMAALEVVKSRLENVGLGDFCLELHSTKANRSSMLADLQRVMSSAPPAPVAYEKEADRLRQTRQQLNDYVAALHQPDGPAGVTPFNAIGKTALLDAMPGVACAMPGFETWDGPQVERMRALIHALKRQLEAVGVPGEHPFRGVRLTLVTNQVRAQAGDLLAKLAALAQTCATQHDALAATMRMNTKATPARMPILALAQLILDTPGNAAALLSDNRWDTTPASVEVLLIRLKSSEKLKAILASRYNLTLADQTDWRPISERARAYWSSFTRWFRIDFWRDRALLNRAGLVTPRPPIAKRINDLAELATLSGLRAELIAGAKTGERHFGEAWLGPDSGWARLVTLGNWLLRMRKSLRDGALPHDALALCAPDADRSVLAQQSQQLAASAAQWHEAWGQLQTLLRIDDAKLFDTPLLQTPADAWHERLTQMISELDRLDEWARYQDALQPCEKSALAGFVAAAEKAGVDPAWLPAAFEKQFHTLWLERFFSQRDALRQFSAGRHEDAIGEFARLDYEWLKQSRHRLYARLAELRPASGFEAAKTSQVGILQGEFRRKRGGRPIRRILKDAGEVIQRTKPCFMMSPLSVAQFLAPEGVRFDVVVFDEASQVEPADALGAIARGGQLILVGDSKQLPPTSFFANLSGDADAIANEGEAGLADMESILDRGESVLTTLSLRWHYRSKHESLINFSNHEFYNNELVIFPSSHTGRGEMGVTLNHDAAHMYDRGKSRVNRAQAASVAAAVFEHYRQNPDKSLGVATFSVAQRQAVLDEVEKLRRLDDSLEAFFDANRPEHFFVKNLETIQGDERDVIFMSVGHGRSIAGERVGASISNLNGETGWRRLNVLITRARERYVVFSSILGQELDLAGTQARGVHSFKRYLEYAQSGRLPTVISRDGEFGSDFEKAVFNALVEKGVTLHRQVGCAGFAIDLCVVDPDMPGRYLLGIECDGATYHSSATARDRDRLRQQVLEGLGWRIHRVWSTDWFSRPKAELARLLDAIARARSGQLAPRFKGLTDKAKTTPPAPTAISAGIGEPAEEKPPIAIDAYLMFALEHDRPPERFYTDSIDQLTTLVTEIAKFEGPVHITQLSRRTAAQYGLERVGEKMQERIGHALARGQASGAITQRDEFIWPGGMKDPPLRRRQDDAVREVDLVCMEELGLAAERLAAIQFGMAEADLISQTARLLGFRVVTARVKSRVASAIQKQIEIGRLTADGGVIKSTTGSDAR